MVDKVESAAGQSVVTLHEHLDEQIAALRQYTDLQIKAIVDATALARQTMDTRLESMNEFRETLRDQASKFTTRDEVQAQVETIKKDIRELRESRAELAGKASQNSVLLSYALAAFSLLLAALALFSR